MDATSKYAVKGGEFIIREAQSSEIFIPEEFSEEQKMMAEATQQFIDKEITPNVHRMDSLEAGFMESLLDKAGELYLLGVSIPETYGGLGMSFVTSMLIADVLGSAGSFSTAFGAHTGIGTLPILYYGTEEQKMKYIPKLASGEWKASYCLTEPGAGSDANSGKTKAVLNEAGTHYLITGQKMWISNAGFADLMIVFARIEDDKNLTAFIVERTYEGITMNEEEHKMGIKGSSTRQVFYNETPVPVENMLSTRGNGFKIAVNILNIGRIKLGAGVLGGCKTVITYGTSYANERQQFGTSISTFGAIQHKIAEMACRTFATESAVYRAGQNIEDRIHVLIEGGLSKEEATLKGVEQFAIECAIMKVHASEVLDFCVDEGVQIYGGMGFSADAPMERAYRDARISRIYEGTNEINRLLILSMLVRAAMKGELDLLEPAMKVGKELLSVPDFSTPDLSQPFAAEKIVLRNLKKAILMIAGKAVQSLGTDLQEEQEVVMNISDMIIECYVAESTILRAEKLRAMGNEKAEMAAKMALIYLHRAVSISQNAGREAITSFVSGDEQKVMLMGLKRFTKIEPINSKEIRRSIAAEIIKKNSYCF